MRRLVVTAVCVAALLGGRVALAGPARGSSPREDIHLSVQNELDGLSWEVRVWRDGAGFHRTTTIRDLSTRRRVSQTVEVSSGSVQALWRQLEELGCWGGPGDLDGGVRRSEAGSLRLAREGRRPGKFSYFEQWKVAAAIEAFGEVEEARMTAREKGLGNPSA